jgi:hypothetical protein
MSRVQHDALPDRESPDARDRAINADVVVVGSNHDPLTALARGRARAIEPARSRGDEASRRR